MTQLVDFSDDDATVEQPNTVRAAPEEAKGVVVDTRYEPKANLLTHVEGAAWTVNYYSQVLNTDNAPTGQQVELNPIYQQYMYIERFDLKVTQPLTSSQDPTTKEMTVVGAANIYPHVIPNKGDMFIADVGDGRDAIFKVTSCERKSIFKDTSYTIEYVLIDYTTKVLRADLDSKVIKKFAFRSDFMKYGQNPMIVQSEAELIRRLEVYFKEIIAIYFRSFLSNEYKTLLVPGQEAPIYDHFLVKAVKAFFNTWDCPDIKYVKLLNLDDDNNMKTMTIWDMLYEMDIGHMNYVAPKSGLVSSKLFTRDPMMEGIYHTGIPYVVYPDTSWKDVDYGMRDRTKPFAPLSLRHVPPRTNLAMFSPEYNKECTYCEETDGFADLVDSYEAAKDDPTIDPTNDINADGTIINDHLWNFQDVLGGNLEIAVPDIHLVTVDEYYVFNRTFYMQDTDTQNPGLSKLECAVCDMLRREKLDNNILVYFCETYHSWGAVERFYYLPILLILIRYSIRGV